MRGAGSARTSDHLREAGAAEPAQPGVAHDLDQVVARARAGKAGLEQRVAAVALISVDVLRGRIGVRMRVRGRGSSHLIGRRLHHLAMADGTDRRPITGAHARRAHDPHATSEPSRQIAQEPLGARHRAGQ
jgi:hypothetical protein